MTRLRAAAAAAGFYGLALSVALAAMPLGSVDAKSTGMLGLFFSLSLLASLGCPPPSRPASRLIGVAFLVCVILVVWTVAQARAGLAGYSFGDLWAAVAENEDGKSVHLAFPQVQPLYALGGALLPFAAFIAAISHIRDARSFTRSADIVLCVGAALTVAALVQHMFFPGYLLFWEKRHYLGSFTGTFVNPNTAATYFGVAFVLSLALMARPWGRLKPLGLLRSGRRFSPPDREQAATLLFYAALALVFGVALLLTRSRAGILASLAALTVLAGGQAFLSLRRVRSLLAAAAGSLLTIVAVAVIFGLFGTRWIARIEAEGVIDEQRLCTYAATWRAIKEHFFWGTGGGTFQDVFPAYRAEACGIDGYWEMAHSVPLEGWVSFGFAFLVSAVIVYGVLIATYVRGLRERRRYQHVPLVCLSILLLVTLHSLVDFSLQIPAVALLVGWALGAGAAVSVGRSTEPTAAVIEP